MRRPAVVFVVLGFALAAFAAAQTNDSDLRKYLDGVTLRGWELYDYDQAAWHGTDAFLALSPDSEGLAHYICEKTPTGWMVVFPAWNSRHDRLLILYEGLEGVQRGKFEARKVDPPRDATPEETAKEKALELVIADFPRQERPYNTAILPGPEGNLYVYLYPGQTKDSIWPIGGDARYTVLSDGTKILEKRQMHKTILDMEYNPENHPAAGFHTHILSDVPEDTDVLYVLTRRPPIPEFIAITPEKLFEVNPNGSIEMPKPCETAGPVPCKQIKNLEKFKK